MSGSIFEVGNLINCAQSGNRLNQTAMLEMHDGQLCMDQGIPYCYSSACVYACTIIHTYTCEQCIYVQLCQQC